MISLDKYQKLKAQVDEAKTSAAEAEGAYQQAMQELKREFGCETPEQAKRMLSDLTAELERTERKLEEALANFEKEWSHAVAHAAETGS